MAEQMIRCDAIEATAATQIRKKLDKHLIDEFSQNIKDGAQFPAVDCYAEEFSDRIIMADGFHRLYAHIHAGKEEILVDLHEGDATAALIHALGANETHGQRRSKSDRRRAIEIALSHPTIGQMSRQEIADICHVSKRTVQRIANQKVIEPEELPPNQGGKAVEPTDDDVRPSLPEPTQEEIELEELRQALKLIKAFPYDGHEAVKLGLSKDDLADLEYVSAWTAAAVIEGRKEHE